MPDRKAAIRSAILGAAVGDALGVPVEFQNRARRKEDPVTGMRKYGTHHQRAGTWSDDSSMIFATMEGLMKAGGYDPESVMREFEGWVQNAAHTPHGEVFDIGNATHSAIRKFSMGSPLSECGGIEEHSNGNGSLMRILPIGLAFADDRKLIEKASEISSLTHAHERSRFCCAFYCLVVSELLHGFDIEQSTFTAWEIMDRAWKFSELERSRFDALHPEKLLNRSEDEIGSSGHVIDTLEAALWVNAQHDSYGDAVLHSVNLGDDTDTTGCVAGGLAGLLYGEKGIPSEWLDVLVKRFEIESMCETFAEITWKV
ncbi:MAG: ADP-ribosylglycohydrolase [Verrucomicrobiales bacterium]|nr:ADP-ribosylglycohydrolase [Verrucomicrobiales bacterium]